MHRINIDVAEQNIYHDCVDELRMRGKPDKLKKVGHIIVYRKKKLEDEKEEVEGTVLGDGGEDVSIALFLYTCGAVSVSSLGSFGLLVIILKHIILLCLSLLEHATFNSISIIRWVGNGNSLSHSRRRSGMRS